MALPSFIDVVTVTTSKRVTSSFINGSRPLYADSVLKYVTAEAVEPDAGDVVLGQAQIGVQRAVKNTLGGVFYIGSNASRQVASDASLFTFNAPATATTQVDPESQGQETYVPVAPAFSPSVFWV